MEYNSEKYKVYSWKNVMMLHWIINPGLAINELVLGQRVPKVSLVDTTSNKPRIERGFVPCPHCNTLHDSRTWSTQNGTAFKNWFGLYCPACAQVIPCLINATSLIILTLTFPVWGWFKNELKRRWLNKQPDRFKNLDLNSIPNPYEKNGWIKQGLSWGLFMFLVMTFLFPLFSGEEITWKSVLSAIPTWIIGGLIFGYSLKVFMGKRGKNTAAVEE